MGLRLFANLKLRFGGRFEAYVLFEVEAQHGIEVEVLRLQLRSRLKL